jgi:diaminopimelate decarboxylase
VPNTYIVVNGVGKHHWLDACPETGLSVNFDSLSEIRTLVPQAIERGWRLGLRVAVSPQIDPDYPDQPAQFGMTEREIQAAVDHIRSQGADIEILHFHLHSNVNNVSEFYRALDECCELAEHLSIRPHFVDLGGGLPDLDVSQRNHGKVGPGFVLEYAQFLADASKRFADLDALWIENGRYLLGPAGILVVSVIDTKWIGGRRFIICDGGRTNHAIESDWEDHPVILVRETGGAYVPSTVCGPNCMAYDWIYKGPLPEEIQDNDRIVYLNAGAYHLPWETRFSRGLCRVLWSHDGKTIKEIRAAEEVESLQGMWRL